MNEEHDVRDLLTRVVPEDPAVDRMVGLARRRRVRRARTAVAAGALAVVAAVAIPLGVERFTSDDAAIDPAFNPQVAAEAYAANPCPDEMPSWEDLPKELPDLATVTAVRYCTNSEKRQFLRVQPSAAEVQAAATPDALVTGLTAFEEEVADLDAPDNDRCASMGYIASGDALALELEDGSQVLVTTDFCTSVSRGDGSKIGGQDLTNAFWRALDTQRSRFAYAGDPSVPLSCTSPDLSGPARPERESVVAAVSCPGDLSEGERLSAAGVAELDRAWRDARVDPDPNLNREDPCLDGDERPDWLLARTDRGDTIRFVDSACGFLTYSTSFDGYVRYQLDTTGAQLTG